MNISEKKLTKNKNKIIVGIYLFIIFISCFAFPIIPTNLEPYESFSIFFMILIFAIRFQLIYLCISIGKILSIIQPNRKLYLFLMMFGVNFIGFLLRIGLEWGESTIMKELTIMNVAIHLYLLPMVILIVYIKMNIKPRKI
jgi:hypothetical protein